MRFSRFLTAVLRALAALLLLAALPHGVTAQSVPTIPDAGFETPGVASAQYGFQYAPAGGPWAFGGGGGIDANYGGFSSGNPNAPEGTQVAFVQITGTVSQSLSGFQAATAYYLTVSAAQRAQYNGAGQTVQVQIDGAAVGSITPAGTAYADYTVGPFTVAAGAHTLSFAGTNPHGGDNTAFLDNVRLSVTPPPAPTPFHAAAAAVSATATTRVEAEDYDRGGQGVAYYDVDSGGQTSYRPDNVGVYQDVNTSGGYGVSWAAAGEWEGYTLNVAQAGLYALTARVGSDTGGGTFHLEFGPVGQIGGGGVTRSAEFTTPYTGGGLSYGQHTDVSVPAVALPVGPLWMRLVVDSAYPGNFDFIRLTPVPSMPTVTGLSFSPNPVANGGSVGGTVTLSGPAPVGGMAVSLASDNASAVPGPVTIYAGQTSAYFTVTTSPVSAPTTANITASGAGAPVRAALSLSPTVSLTGLWVYPPGVGGGTAYGYLSLNGPAPAGGTTVSFISDNAVAQVPATVTVPAGNSSWSFSFPTTAVTVPATATITASAGGASQTASMTVSPLGLSSLYLSPDSAHGGDAVTGYVNLNGPAPAGGVTVGLSSGGAAAQVPASGSVVIPAGQWGKDFPVTTSAVSAATPVTVTATGAGGPQTATLTLIPLSAPSGLTASAVATGPGTVLVTLYWAGGSGATGYSVERSGDGSTWATVGTTGGTSYQDGSAAPGAYYYYRVRAAGGGGLSNAAWVSTYLPYLVATDLGWTPGQPVVGDQVHFFAVIQNQGTAPSQPFNWSVEFEGDAYAGFNIEANPLAPGDTLLVTENWSQYWTATAGVHQAAVVIDDSYVSLTRTITVVPDPTALTVTAVSGSSVSLSWGASAGATGYSVYRGTSPGGEGAVPFTAPGTTYTDTTVTAGTTYYYTVRAAEGAVASGPSNEVSATPGVAVTASAAFVKTDTTTKGSWQHVYGADGWNVSQDPGANNPSYPAFATVGLYGQSGYTWEDPATDVRATQKAPYNSWYRLAACWYAPLSFGFDVSLTDGNAHQVALYGLDWDGYGGGRAETVQVLDAGSGAVLDSRSLSSFGGGAYLVWNVTGHVRFAVISTAPSPSPVISGLFFGGSVPFPPPAPTNLTATASAATVTPPYVSLFWTGKSGVDYYNVYRSTTPGGETGPPIGKTSMPTGNYTDYNSGITAGTTYYYKVVAVNGGGEGPKSAEASATPGSTPLPAPTIKATAGATQVSVSWSAVPGATSYNLYRSTGSGSYPNLFLTGLTGTTRTDTGLTSGTPYNYQVAAVSRDGQGVLSGIATATPGSTPPAAPTGLTATGGLSLVTLSWTRPDGVYNFNVYRSTTPGGEAGAPLATVDPFGNPFIDRSVVNGVTYYYKVASVTNAGEGPLSGEASASGTFTLTASPAGVTIAQGASGVITVGTDSTSPVTLSVAGLPSGASGWFYLNPATSATNNPYYLCVAASVPAGTYTLTFAGVSGSLTKTAPPVTLTVTPP